MEGNTPTETSQHRQVNKNTLGDAIPTGRLHSIYKSARRGSHVHETLRHPSADTHPLIALDRVVVDFRGGGTHLIEQSLIPRNLLRLILLHHKSAAVGKLSKHVQAACPKRGCEALITLKIKAQTTVVWTHRVASRFCTCVRPTTLPHPLPSSCRGQGGGHKTDFVELHTS